MVNVNEDNVSVEEISGKMEEVAINEKEPKEVFTLESILLIYDPSPCNNLLSVDRLPYADVIEIFQSIKNVSQLPLVLKIIKGAQQQHGLRHSDYQRYRGYCSRRIRRMRKVLHVTQGDKRHFKKKDITEAMITDEKFLHIPLMMAERAWAYAMQLRQEANTEPRKKYHLLGRLRKAVVYAQQFQQLCESSRCDARTKLEVQAYVAWIQGSLFFERKMWVPAMENLKNAQVVYEKLAAALPEEDQPLYQQRVDELSPSLRYCAYNIGEDSSIEDLLNMRTKGYGDLMSNIDSLMVQSREKQVGDLATMEWRGRNVAVRPERARLFLLSERGTDASLKSAADVTARIEILDSLLMDCKDAVASVKEEIKTDQGSKTRAAGEALSSLQYLLTYLMHIRLTRTVERNLLLVEQALTEEANETRAKSRPRDLARLYEIILQNLAEMQQLPGLEEDASYQQDVENKITAYKAFRCFYIAQILVGLRRWREAMALYQRSQQYVKNALKASSALKDELTKLQTDIEESKFSAHAYSVLEGEEPEDETAVGTKSQRIKKPLSERLSEYIEDPTLCTRNPNVYKLPPDMEPIPCKPLFFDLALNWVEFPPLDDKIEGQGKKGQTGITGFVKGLWGWGGSGTGKN